MKAERRASAEGRRGLDERRANMGTWVYQVIFNFSWVYQTFPTASCVIWELELQMMTMCHHATKQPWIHVYDGEEEYILQVSILWDQA